MPTPSRPDRAPSPRPALARAAPHAAAAAVVLLIVAVTWVRARWLLADPNPIGIDGHYYVVQLRSLLEGGTLNYAASPLAFWLLWPGAALFGPLVGLKLGAALGSALAIWPAYVLGRRAGQSLAAGLLAAALVATSAQVTFLSAEFVKQGLGLTIALGQLAALAVALERPRRVWFAAAIGLALAALLVHKSSFVIVAIINVAALAAAGRLRPRWFVAGGGVLAAVLVASAIFPERLPGLRDLGTALAALSGEPAWSLPALITPRVTLTFDHEALAAALLGLAALPLYVLARRAGRSPMPLIVGAAVFAILQGVPWLDVHDIQGAALRIRISAFVVLPVLATFVLVELAGSLPEGIRAPRLLAASLAVALVVARPFTGGEGVVHADPGLVQVARAAGGLLPPGGEIVTQDRQLAFMIRYHAGVDCRVRLTKPVPGVPRYRVFVGNLMRVEPARALRDAINALWAEAPPGVILPRTLNSFSDLGAVIMPEATWELLEARLPAAARAHFAAWPTM